VYGRRERSGDRCVFELETQLDRAARNRALTGGDDARHLAVERPQRQGGNRQQRGTVQDAKERLRHKSLQTTMGYLHADHTKQQVLVDLMPRLELPAAT